MFRFALLATNNPRLLECTCLYYQQRLVPPCSLLSSKALLGPILVARKILGPFPMRFLLQEGCLRSLESQLLVQIGMFASFFLAGWQISSSKENPLSGMQYPGLCGRPSEHCFAMHFPCLQHIGSPSRTALVARPPTGRFGIFCQHDPLMALNHQKVEEHLEAETNSSRRTYKDESCRSQ